MTRPAVWRLSAGATVLALAASAARLVRPHTASGHVALVVGQFAFGLLGLVLVFWGLVALRRRIGWRRVTLIFVVLMGAAFAGFTAWTHVLPTLRGSTWTFRDALVRAAAIGTGVLFLVSLVITLLPWLLDRLERGPFETYIAARHVRAKKSGFLTLISVL
jgi:lipoprotein-releasing system permease protein